MRTSIAFRLASSRILPALFLALEEKPSDYPYLYREAARHVPITPDALREIRRRLDDPEEQCWELALYLLGIHGDQTEIPEILRVLDSESANGVDTALEALVEMGQVAIPHLCAALRSSDASLRLRRLCAGGLRGIGHRDASVSEAIGQAVKDGESGDSSLLESALLAACVLRDRTHADAAVRGLSHKDPDVVLAAARYLAELPVPEAAESLDEALSVWAGESDQEHRIHTVRRQLAFALAQTGRLDGLHRVVGLLEESLHG
jgi:HEAT repeat protein